MNRMENSSMKALAVIIVYVPIVKAYCILTTIWRRKRKLILERKTDNQGALLVVTSLTVVLELRR